LGLHERFPFYPARRLLSGFIRANVKGRFAVPILSACKQGGLCSVSDNPEILSRET